MISEIFKFTEYVTFSAFVLYLAKKTEFTILYVFSSVLYGCVLWYVMDKQIAFVKILKFQNIWFMRIASLVLLIVGVAVVLVSLALALSIASAQR